MVHCCPLHNHTHEEKTFVLPEACSGSHEPSTPAHLNRQLPACCKQTTHLNSGTTRHTDQNTRAQVRLVAVATPKAVPGRHCNTHTLLLGQGCTHTTAVGVWQVRLRPHP
jgi:hypothetical protein